MSKGIDLKLDKAWSEYVKLRAGNRCEKCKNKNYLNSHHIFGRRNKSVRWEISNGCCLCVGCHKFSSKFSAHETPTLFTDWIKAKRGEEWYDELRIMANTPKKWTKYDKEELLKELTEAINENKM